jgi:hypothetical protein
MFFRDCYGSTAAGFEGSWRVTVSSDSSSWLGVGLPDPTWGGTKEVDLAYCNTQNVGVFRADPSIPAESTRVDAEHGFLWIYFTDPPSTFTIDVRVSGAGGATTRGLAMCDYRDPANDWCRRTDNIDPADWRDLAVQIEASLDSGSLCGNEGLIQACAAYAGSRYHSCREAAHCMAGLLRSVGIPASADDAYQIAATADFGGIGVSIPGGMHAQVSAWNWTAGEWERCDPAYAAGFVHPAHVKIGGVLDPEYLAPRMVWFLVEPTPSLQVQYLSGEYGDDASFSCIQYRDDDVLGVGMTLATLCFAGFQCGKIETMPDAPPDALSGIGTAFPPPESPILPLVNPSRGGIVFRSASPARIDLYEVSGRWVGSISGSGEIRAPLDPGVYLYRAAGIARPSAGKLIVLQ